MYQYFLVNGIISINKQRPMYIVINESKIWCMILSFRSWHSYLVNLTLTVMGTSALKSSYMGSLSMDPFPLQLRSPKFRLPMDSCHLASGCCCQREMEATASQATHLWHSSAKILDYCLFWMLMGWGENGY